MSTCYTKCHQPLSKLFITTLSVICLILNWSNQVELLGWATHSEKRKGPSHMLSHPCLPWHKDPVAKLKSHPHCLHLPRYSPGPPQLWWPADMLWHGAGTPGGSRPQARPDSLFVIVFFFCCMYRTRSGDHDIERKADYHEFIFMYSFVCIVGNLKQSFCCCLPIRG